MASLLTRFTSSISRRLPSLRGKRKDRQMDFVQQLLLLERGEKDDHEAALALQNGKPLPPPTLAQLAMQKTSFAEAFRNFLVADKASVIDQPEVGPSTSTNLTQGKLGECSKRKSGSVECVICCDTFGPMACLDGLSCGHFICHQCVISMAEVASKDEGLLPLRCCQREIPMDAFLSFLPSSLCMSFSSKCAEVATPPNLRIYCSNKRCLNFISRSLSLTPHVVSCSKCETNVCTKCRTDAHPGESCDDKQDYAVHDLAKKNGWKRCPKCEMIVERASGCSRMTCKCKQNFCYICGKKWSKCRCYPY